MSNFKFQVKKISKLEKSKTIVVDGFLLDGKVLTSSSAILSSDEKNTPIVIKGVALGQSTTKESNNISLVIDLTKSKSAVELIKEGDFLIGN